MAHRPLREWVRYQKVGTEPRRRTDGRKCSRTFYGVLLECGHFVRYCERPRNGKRIGCTECPMEEGVGRQGRQTVDWRAREYAAAGEMRELYQARPMMDGPGRLWR